MLFENTLPYIYAGNLYLYCIRPYQRCHHLQRMELMPALEDDLAELDTLRAGLGGSGLSI